MSTPPTPARAQKNLRRSSLRRRRQRSDPHTRARASYPVFIAYAESSAVRSAMMQLDALLSSAGIRHEIRPMFWRFDQLDQPQWREMALSDAARSALVVLALSDDDLLNTGA